MERENFEEGDLGGSWGRHRKGGRSDGKSEGRGNGDGGDWFNQLTTMSESGWIPFTVWVVGLLCVCRVLPYPCVCEINT